MHFCMRQCEKEDTVTFCYCTRDRSYKNDFHIHDCDGPMSDPTSSVSSTQETHSPTPGPHVLWQIMRMKMGTSQIAKRPTEATGEPAMASNKPSLLLDQVLFEQMLVRFGGTPLGLLPARPELKTLGG